jgi:hypothetical protein
VVRRISHCAVVGSQWQYSLSLGSFGPSGASTSGTGPGSAVGEVGAEPVGVAVLAGVAEGALAVPGDGVGVSVGVGVVVGALEAVGEGVTLGVGERIGLADGVAEGVGVAVGGVGVSVGVDVGVGVSVGVEVGVGVSVGVDVGVGVSVGVDVGVGVGGAARYVANTPVHMVDVSQVPAARYVPVAATMQYSGRRIVWFCCASGNRV